MASLTNRSHNPPEMVQFQEESGRRGKYQSRGTVERFSSRRSQDGVQEQSEREGLNFPQYRRQDTVIQQVYGH